MLRARVIGNVWSTKKVSSIPNGAFLEVEVDRMVPAAAAIDVGPMLDLPRLRDQFGDAVGVHGMRRPAVDLDGPREGRGTIVGDEEVLDQQVDRIDPLQRRHEHRDRRRGAERREERTGGRRDQETN